MRLLECILTESDCFRTGEVIVPRGVMIHSTGANNPTLRRYVQPADGDEEREALLERIGANRNGNHWNRPGLQAGVHAFVGRLADGTVACVQTLPWDRRGWHAGTGKNGSANDTHISFEICEDGLDDASYFSAVYREAVELTAMLCSRFGLDPMADGVVICHSEGYARGIACNHGDVMHWFPRHGRTMDDFRSDVAEKVEAEWFRAMMERYRGELREEEPSPYSGEARRWAVEKGLVLGDSGDEFRGMWKDFLTREQLVTVLYRFQREILQ